MAAWVSPTKPVDLTAKCPWWWRTMIRSPHADIGRLTRALPKHIREMCGCNLVSLSVCSSVISGSHSHVCHVNTAQPQGIRYSAAWHAKVTTRTGPLTAAGGERTWYFLGGPPSSASISDRWTAEVTEDGAVQVVPISACILKSAWWKKSCKIAATVFADFPQLLWNRLFVKSCWMCWRYWMRC